MIYSRTFQGPSARHPFFLGRYLQTWIDERRNQLIEDDELVVNLELAGRGS